MRGHSLYLGKSVRFDIGKYSLRDKVVIVNEWNMLNEETIESSSLLTFKRKLDMLHALYGYNRGQYIKHSIYN